MILLSFIFLGVAVAYVAFFWQLYKKAKPLWGRVAAVVVAVLIPFWEFPIGYWQLSQLCRTEGGNHIDPGFARSRSIAFDSSFHQRPREVMVLGYDIVEYVLRDEVVRYERSGDGITESIAKAPTSNILLRRDDAKRLRWNIYRYDKAIVRIKDGTVVARQTDFYWRGMSWESSAQIRVTPGTNCAGAHDVPLLTAISGVK